MTFTDLTWEALKNWAGDRVVARGKTYRRRVEDLCVTADGALLAWVQGGDRYATLVRMGNDETVSSQCTCPYGAACKHAVAVILSYLDSVKNQQKPPVADPDDERFDELAELVGTDDEAGAAATLPNASPQATQDDERVRAHLNGLAKAELVKLLMEERNSIPELRQQLADKEALQGGQVAKLVVATRKEIERAAREPGWADYWRGESHIPDYSRVKQRLEALLAAGQADAVVELGAHLLNKGLAQVGQSQDEGETGLEIAGAMAVVFRAVSRSSLSAPEQIRWEIDARLQDEYSILDGLTGPVAAGHGGQQAAWSQVADTLAGRLANMPVRQQHERDEFSSTYKRARVMYWLLRALEKAGRAAESIAILERETAQTDCYEELVQRLAASGCADKARAWARKGFAATLKDKPGIAWQLEAQLRELAVQDKNAPLVAAYRAVEFFNQPSLPAYTALQAAAVTAKVWDGLRERVLHFLETGKRPDTHDSSTLREDATASTWPLPKTELPAVPSDSRWTRFPDRSTLIDIAINEGRHDDVLRWYRQGRQPGAFNGDAHGSEVAKAVSKSHPDDALAIWKELVAREIALVKPAAYQTAGGYLSKMKQVYADIGRADEWHAYVAELRLSNHRRPRMLEVLNSIDGCRTPLVE